jgi:polyhydroxyalkanoate synthesis repressor PhaR
MSQERLIKKYANRRLYDASQSRHITLDDIRALIVKGEKIKVVEDKTGHDITRHILLQVIAEQEQFGRPILSTPVLESIIRFYGSSMQGFWRASSRRASRPFCDSRTRCRASCRRWWRIHRSRPSPTSPGRISRHCRRSRKRCWAGWRPNATNNDVPGAVA